MSNKTYLRYSQSDSFGVVASHESCIVSDSKGQFAITSGVQDVLLWNLKSSELSHRFKGDNDLRETCVIVLSNDDKLMAVGHASGIVNLWNFETKDLLVSLNGHKHAVTSLRFSSDSTRLVSGGRDTDIIVWDVVGRTGLFRLRGHKEMVTDLRFVADSNSQLFSSSKDTLIKCWDLETQHCVNTFVGHRSPVWSIDMNKSGDRLVTVSSDNLIRAFSLVSKELQESEIAQLDSTDTAVTETVDAPRQLGAPWQLMQGGLTRQSNERGQTISYSRDGSLLAVQSAGKTLEVYRVRTRDEVEKKIKRRLKRIREKKGSETSESSQPQLTDELQLLASLKTDHKMRSFAFGKSSSTRAQVIISFTTNCVEIYKLDVESDDVEEEDEDDKKKRKRGFEVSMDRTRTIELPGHRSDVRGIAISGDDTLLLTAASGAAKLWNVKSKTCIRTLPSGYSLCCAFVPGDMHALIGTKTGHLLLFNLSSGQVLSDIAAHDDALWSIDVRPDGKGFVTGSADKQVKFWEFDMVYPNGVKKEESSSSESSDSDSDTSEDPKRMKTEPRNSEGVLDVVHVRTLKVNEDVMCVKYSHHRSSARLMLAVALLDSTVKLFHEDSLKFALSLYGHKLPVLSMDISSDNSLIITGSADKNVKVWGLDFGDCHKSFFAHDASVMSVRFVPRTHYFFTAGKDQRIRYWDADKFEMILSLDGHVGEVWSLAVASDGGFIASSGHDKSLRLWERSADIVFIDEEKEKELEKKFDEKLLADVDQAKVGTASVAVIAAGGATEAESGIASRKTNETLRAGERLMEALDIADEAKLKLKTYLEDLEYETERLTDEERKKLEKSGKPLIPVPTPNLMMMGRTPCDYVIHVLRSIKQNELDEALLVQPFSYALRLFSYLHEILSHEIEKQDIEVTAKVSIALVKIHFKQLVATETLRAKMADMKVSLRLKLQEVQDILGTNVAALRSLKTQIAETSMSRF